MKQIFTCLLFSMFFISSALNAQNRYIDEIFTDVTVEADVTYGVNGTLLFLPVLGEVVPQALQMDIYQPEGDTETDRPAVLIFHNGNFLPPVTNGQISGTRQDSSVVEIATQLAKRGYVAATVSYRLGWNPLAPTQPERALGLIQAAYRGVQDGTTAVRYLKATVDGGNPYAINPDKIVAWGVGTGGYVTLAMATLNNEDASTNTLTSYSEILTTTNGPGKFLLDTDGDGTPETPMVVQSYHGDIEGKNTTVVPANGFGLTLGDTTNYANLPDYSSKFALAVNIGGALGDISWLDEESTPTISVQSPFDIFAPYADEVLVVPTTNDPIVRVQGSLLVAGNQDLLGNNATFDQENYTDVITETAKANAATADHDYYEGLFPFIRPVNSGGIPEGVVLNWWDPAGPSPADGQGMGIPWNMLPHPSDPTGETSFHENGLVLNEGMSAEKSRANIADVMAFVLPRACVSLGLGDCIVSSVENLPLSNTELTISPNPASSNITVAADNSLIESIVISDIQGKIILNAPVINTTSQTLDISALNSGMYIVKAKLEDGISTSKLTVK